MMGAQLRKLLGAVNYHNGLNCQQQKRVLEFAYRDQETLVASVRGNVAKPYQQTIRIKRDSDGSIGSVLGHCTCPQSYNCQHVAAALIASAETSITALPEVTIKAVPAAPVLSPALESWLASVRAADAATAGNDNAYPDNVRERLIYVADADPKGRLHVSLMRGSVLKNGSLGRSARDFNFCEIAGRSAQKFIRPADFVIIRKLDQVGLGARSHCPEVAPGEVMEVLNAIAATGRGYWGCFPGPRLAAAPARTGRLGWRTTANGWQAIEARDEAGAPLRLLDVNPPAWIDPHSGAFGLLQLDAPPHLSKALLAAPPVPPEAAVAVSTALGNLVQARPALPAARATEFRHGRAPVPVLRLMALTAQPLQSRWSRCHHNYASGGTDETTVTLGALRLSFDYDGHVLPLSPRGDYRFDEGGLSIILRRDIAAEDRALALLALEGSRRVEWLEGLKVNRGGLLSDFVFVNDIIVGSYGMEDAESAAAAATAATTSRALQFMAETLPELEHAGWRIEQSPDWPYQVYQGPVVVRASTQAAGTDWFALGLGLDVNGKRLDLVPLIQSIIKLLPVDKQGALPADFNIGGLLEDTVLYQHLDDGTYVQLKAEVLEPLVKIFLTAQGLLGGFHSAEAGRLAAVAEALAGCGVAFDGGQALLDLGRKLRALAAMPFAEPPASLTATLRPYQKSGYGWLRALSDTGFGGVLADDMGLGKTVQTLALLADSHLEGKADRPSLLIVPTSLVGTWVREAARFAPGLKVLVLHGADRHGRFAAIAGHHIAITTYPLLHRDHEKLFGQDWQAVILDEAHAVKNPASNAAKCIRLARCRFRLALTGTPMENNLEDMWSLFDWLIPGLLGNRKAFRTRFRTPIEQHGDVGAQALLNGRIRPFILRRAKADVAIDLPQKTVITETVTLGERQRGLYETIRLSVDERVRDAIAAKGIAASRITILAALLKLRQVCCDPALLKLNGGETLEIASAKRERLLEMLEALIAEGRRVVVFSQFVGMLRLIEAEVKARGWGYEWLTGDTKDRDGAVSRFQWGTTPLFLISLKAGGTGLTLTAADTVILYDPWWNPAVERQAMDRVHRIGQDRPVFIYRMVAEGAVEEAIVKLQEKKQALADALFDGAANSPLTLGEDDIAMLFQPIA